MGIGRWVIGGAVLVAAAAFIITPLANNASKEKELSCPRGYENHTHIELGVESSVDELVQTHGREKASLVVLPQGPQHGDLLVCGEGALFVQLAGVTGRVLVAGNGARVVREENLPAPNLTVQGTRTDTVLCARDGVKSTNQLCRDFLPDARGLHW